VLPNTSSPTWLDEECIIQNIPSDAKLLVQVYDKRDGRVADASIGELEISDLVHYCASSSGHPLLDSSGQWTGRFHLTVQLTEASPDSQRLPRYTFDGPCRYSRYDTISTGRLNTANDECSNSIWKIHLRRVSCFFPSEKRQQWNRLHKPARDLFAQYSTPSVARSTGNRSESGRIKNASDLWEWMFLDRETEQIQPRIFNYVIDDTTWQFSETGHQFFGAAPNKHILLANCSEFVCVAGEFHLRPKFGWTRPDDEWELVFDNASGTYSPDADLLINLKELLAFNFPGLNVITYDYKDPTLKDSIEQLEIAVQTYKHKISRTRKTVLSH
jgi:hypothetical protein